MHKSQQDKPHEICNARSAYTNVFDQTTTKIICTFPSLDETQMWWKCSLSEWSKANHIVKTKKNLSVFPCPGTATTVSEVMWARIGGSAMHLTGPPCTLIALCSGMLVLEAATTKIKRRYFPPPHPRPANSTFPWQQSGKSKGVRLLLFKEAWAQKTLQHL